MKKIILNKDYNSKKLYIGVSILFCTVILILGGTIAYFTQSDTKNLDSLLTADIRDTLEYTDDTTYMRQGLIPAKEGIAKQAYALEDINKCIDIKGYSACSVYQFNIKNIANVSQDLIINIAPTLNGFANLYFMLYEIDENGNSVGEPTPQKLDTITEEMVQNSTIPSYNLVKNLSLNPGKDKTYEIVFFVNDTGTDQTLEDSGKSFGATIKISSVTTGKYMVESFGEDCWDTELLSDGTYKLTEFYGIDNTGSLDMSNGSFTPSDTYGNIKKECENIYVKKYNNTELYTVNIPSQIGEQKISTIGHDLFFFMDLDMENQSTTLTNYYKVKEFNIAEGITTIEGGPGMEMDDGGKMGGSFLGVGYDFPKQTIFIEDGVIVNLPNTLTTIGDSAFSGSVIKNITLPSNLEIIGEGAFEDSFDCSILESIKIPKSVHTIEDAAFNSNSNLKSLTFEVDEEGSSNLKTIKSSAFSETSIENPIIIPSSVETIGNSAFAGDSQYQLSYPSVTFTGAKDGTSQLKEIGESAFYNNPNISSVVIPASVTSIGKDAFGNNKNLKTVNIINTNEHPSQLEYLSGFSNTIITEMNIPKSVTSIGDSAFRGTQISSITIPASVTSIGEIAFSSTQISSITIPKSVSSIGNYAFGYNSNLTRLTFEMDEDRKSSLTTIGQGAFNECALDYQNEDSPLYLPNNEFEVMGFSAFGNNPNLKYIYFEGDETGFGSYWNGDATLLPRRN